MPIMSTFMIVIVCVVYDSKIMAKLMKNARIEFADTANTGSKSDKDKMQTLLFPYMEKGSIYFQDVENIYFIFLPMNPSPPVMRYVPCIMCY